MKNTFTSSHDASDTAPRKAGSGTGLTRADGVIVAIETPEQLVFSMLSAIAFVALAEKGDRDASHYLEGVLARFSDDLQKDISKKISFAGARLIKLKKEPRETALNFFEETTRLVPESKRRDFALGMYLVAANNGSALTELLRANATKFGAFGKASYTIFT